MRTARTLLAGTAAAALAGCAGSPARHDAPPPGHQVLEFAVYTMLAVPYDAPVHEGPGSIRAEAVTGLQCTFRNEKGSWSAVLPGRVTVAVAGGPMHMACDKPGYLTTVHVIPCRTPRSRAVESGVMLGLLAAQLAGPAAIAAAVAPGAFVAAAAASAATGAAVGSATSGPDADICDYGPKDELHIFVEREGTGPR